jgi:hypothetical protein
MMTLLGVFETMFPVSVKIRHGSNELLNSVAEKTKNLDSLKNNKRLLTINDSILIKMYTIIH